MTKEEETSELEEELDSEEVKEIITEIISEEPKQEFEEIEGDFNIRQFHEFVNPIESVAPPVLEQIASTQQQNIEQDFTPKIETQEPQRMYGNVAKEEKRLYESQSRNIEPPVLTPNRRMTQQAGFIDPLQGMNIPTQDNMQPEMIRTQLEHKKQRLPFEREEDNYREVKL